jgi:hypothetical protein
VNVANGAFDYALATRAVTAISQHPAVQNTCLGGAAQFTVAASGGGALTYQWQKDGIDLGNGGDVSGADTSTLQLANISGDDTGNYRCIVSGGCATATSNEAALTLRNATVITQDPQSVSVCAGAPATLTVWAAGEGALTYQWQKVGVDVEGATSATLQIDHAGSATAGSYRCVVSGECGSVVSNPAILDVALFIADFDEDCDADLSDFSLFQTCFNGPNRPPAVGCTVNADFDNDADVDLIDFAMFQACFNGPNRAPGFACPQR